jgi:flagellar hook-associated protein FlgK
MTSAFFGLNTSANALRTAQTLVDIANQNIANANTPGYSRQSATVTATTPFPVPASNAGGSVGQLGTGVQIAQVSRARDTFIDTQMHGQLTIQGEVDAKRDALAQVEATINEPSTTGLGSTVTKYWAAWQEVANSPSDSAVRTNLVEAGKAVADVFQSTVTQFKAQQTDIDTQTSLGVTSVNTYASQIAALNTQIAQVENGGMKANDLRDQRDLAVDRLSSMVKINVSESANGQLNINVGNHQLVDRDEVHPMQAGPTATGVQVQWSAGSAAVATGSISSPAPAVVTGGSMSINGISVATVAGQSAATVAGSINAAAGLGPTGTVTASVSAAGALVLTANTRGAAGSVVLGAGTGSANADFGLTAGTTIGISDVVSLGGGKLQGLVDSHVLLQERIDDVNALASRMIESVNSVQVSGVGLDGKGGINFFSGSDATDMAIDPNLTAAGGSDHVAAARMTLAPNGTYAFAAGDSSNAVALAQIQNAVSQRVTSTGTGLAPNQLLSPSTSTVLGVDLSRATANTTYSFSVSAGSPPVVSVNNGTSSTPASVTVGVDAAVPPNSIINVDTGSVRLTLSAPNGTSLSAALAGLSGTAVTTQPGPTTMATQYAQQIAALGVESQTVKSQSANQQVLISHLDTQRQQTSGVSLDEETVNLMMYQKAYQAAARVVTVMDGLLDTLINMKR